MERAFNKVLVTGGAGCIGLQVCHELSRRGIEVVLFDLPEQVVRIERHVPQGTSIYYGSILDECSLRDAMVGCTGVIHLAAYLGVRRTETNRLRCIEININGTKKLLDCAMQQGVSKVVFASSSEVYGEPLKNPITEKEITQGKTVYAISKLAGEELCKAYHQRYPHFQYTILRYFNAYGPFQIAQFVIPKFIRNALEGHPPVIYGSGEQKRTYCYASDTAFATVESLVREEANSEVFNIGNSDTPITLIDLARLVIHLCKKSDQLVPKHQSEFVHTDRQESREIFERYCDTSKARSVLNFAPRVSLEEGLKKVIEHGIIFPKWATTDLVYTLDDWV